MHIYVTIDYQHFKHALFVCKNQVDLTDKKYKFNIIVLQQVFSIHPLC